MLNKIILTFTSIIFVQSIKVLPQVTIDLSANPKQIWTPAMEAISKLYSWEESFEVVFKYHNETLFDCMPQGDFQKIGQAIQQNYPDKEAELIGIQQDFLTYFNQEVSYNYLAAWVYFHELSHTDEEICQEKSQKQVITQEDQPLPYNDYIKGLYQNSNEQQNKDQFVHSECTGILVKKADGGVIHGRNLDQNPAVGMRNIAVNMTLVQNGNVVGYATDVYWFNTGFVTAFIPGVVSLEENYRYDAVQYDDLIQNIINGVYSQVWPFRDIVENQKVFLNFYQILDYLQNIPSGAPMYNIVGGVDDGAVITFSEIGKDENNPIYTLNNDGIDGWFLVQTNYDLWKDDKKGDNRRTIATNMLKQMGQDIAETNVGLFAIMDSYSVHNDHTVYTGLMDPKNKYYQFFGNDGIKQVSAN